MGPSTTTLPTGLSRGGRLRCRIRLLRPLLPLLLTPLALLGPAARAQAPQPWLLDHFEVVQTEDDLETSRRTIAGGSEPSFQWGGRYENPNLGTEVATGTLKIVLPEAIVPGVAFSIGGEAEGTVSTPGRTGRHAATLAAFGECYLPQVCAGTYKSQYLDDVGGKTVGLAVTMPPVPATLPLDPTSWPPSHVLLFRGGLGTTTPGDRYWRIKVYAYYQRQDAPATAVPAYSLDLDSDTRRLPPSGSAASTSRVTAKVSDGAGRPAAGEAIRFTLDPPDMGRLSVASGVTDAQGEARVAYQAPTVAELRGRDAVAIVATDAARNLQRRLELRIERYRLSLTVDPAEIPIEAVWRAVRVTATVTDFDGRPVAGDLLRFTVDPPDMGGFLGETLIGDRAPTDAGGRVALFYEPPPPSQLRGRDSATLRAENLTHGGDIGAGVRFLGLKVIRTWPLAGARDVQLEPGDDGNTIDLEFDRALDPASVSDKTVRVETLWHGNLNAVAKAQASTIQLRLGQDPLPDVGLKVSVHVTGGEGGVKGRDGSLMIGPYHFRFLTLPRLHPKLIVSQVVDNPRDPLYGFISLALKSFVLRVEAGIPADSELDEERVSVRLMVPRRGEERTLEHVFYPGRWPPTVPDAAARKGNSANFVFQPPFGRGGHEFRVELRPVHAIPEKVETAEPVTANVNSWAEVGAATKLGMLAVPLINDRLPGSDWKLSRGQQEQWLLGLAQPAANLLPLTRLDLRLGYLADSTCYDPDVCRFERAPWTEFLHWTQNVGRSGFMTRIFGWRYIVALVPPNWFDRFADHPDVLAHPNLYHDAVQNGIWFYRSGSERGRVGASTQPVALMEAGTSPEALVHVLGDMEGLADSSAAQDSLDGYDLLNDRWVHADAERWTGAPLSVMNLGVGFGPSWPSTAQYEQFLDLWTQRSCSGPPPCPPRFAANREPARTTARSQEASGSALLLSGTLRYDAAGRLSGSLDPLVTVDGSQPLGTEASGDATVELRDAAGTVLGHYRFHPVFEPAGDGVMAGFLFTVPARPAPASVAIIFEGGTAASRRKSANPPSVHIVAPRAGDPRRGPLDVTWNGSDADGDVLSYSLFFSADNGLTWEPLLMDSKATSLRLDSALLGNAPDARLRLVASDGFDSAKDEVVFGLDNAPAVLALAPADGARGVPPRTLVQARLRDPLDAAQNGGSLLSLRDSQGNLVAGEAGYSALDRTLVFTPALALAQAATYQARLSGAARTADGRVLGSDRIWHFSTRGQTVHLPFALQSGNANPRTATPSATRPPGPPPTPRPSPSAGPTRGPSPTVDVVGTAVAATLTALAPTATRGATATASLTPDRVATAVAATLTALAPTPTMVIATPTTGATPGGGPPTLTALSALTTGADINFMRMAFVPGDAIVLWTQVQSSGSSPVDASFDFAVQNAADEVLPALSWSGTVSVPPGSNWFKLERTVPQGIALGPLSFRGTVTFAGAASSATSTFELARDLRVAEDFGNAASGWLDGQDGNGVFGYLGGEYRLRFTIADGWRWSAPPNSPLLSDLVLEADVRMPEATGGAAALVFGLSQAGDDFHLFEIDNTGSYSMYRRQAGAWQTLLRPAPSAALRTGTVANHLMLVRASGLTRLYANGQRISLVTDLPAPAGRVALYASSVAAGFEARWDNFRAYGLR
jgi:hypothetical protein